MPANPLPNYVADGRVGLGSFALTPGSTVISPPIRSLRCDGAGTVTFEGLDSVADTWTVAAGEIIPIAMTRVTSATATGLHGIY